MARPITVIITDEMLGKIEMMAGWGLARAQIAAVLGFSETTLIRKKVNEKRVSDALEAGKAKAQGRVGKSLFERAVEGDVAAIRWYEMTRAGRTAEARLQQSIEAKVVMAKAPDWTALLGNRGPDDAA